MRAMVTRPGDEHKPTEDLRWGTGPIIEGQSSIFDALDDSEDPEDLEQISLSFP